MKSTARAGVPAILVVLAIAPPAIGIATSPGTVEPSAEELLARTAQVYAKCTSYQDSGVVKITFAGPTTNRVEERPFRTAFVRPDRFRFEFEEKNPLGKTEHYIVWRFESQVQTWWDLKPGVEDADALGLALAGATGVSGGSAHAIPALLLPDEVKGGPTTMIGVRRVADAEVGGVACYCVEGSYGGRPQRVCIDRRSFLVRRIEFESAFQDFRTRETITYEPLVDELVPEMLLEFDPPSNEPRRATGAIPEFTVETARVEDVFKAFDQGFRFIAYVVTWHGQRVVVDDVLCQSDHRVGDEIRFMASRGASSLSSHDGGLLHFMILEHAAPQPTTPK